MILRTFACALLATAFMGAFSVEVSLAEAGYHFFGGKRVSLPFKAPVKPCEKIRVQLYTATGSMEAPIGEPVVNDALLCCLWLLPRLSYVPKLGIPCLGRGFRPEPSLHTDKDATG